LYNETVPLKRVAIKGLGFLFKPSTLSEYKQLIQSYSGDLFFNSGLLRLIVKKIVKVYSDAISYYKRCLINDKN
jgi:hypothetical protein